MRFGRIGFLIGLVLFGWILSRADLNALWGQVQDLHWRFGLVVLFYAVIFGLDTLGWLFTLRPQVRSQVPLVSLFRARLAGEAVNYVTPAASIGGEPVKAYLLLRRFGIPLKEGMASVVIAKTTFAFSMLLFVILGLAITLFTRPLPDQILRWVWGALALLVLLLSLFIGVQFLQPFRRGAVLLRRFLPRFRTRGKAWDESIVGFYRKSPGATFWSVLFHFLGWMAGVLEVYLILYFLGIPVNLSTAWSIEALWVLLRSGAFFIPASLGASEGFSLLICVALGMSAVSGLGLALIRRAREILWMGAGLAEYARD